MSGGVLVWVGVLRGGRVCVCVGVRVEWGECWCGWVWVFRMCVRWRFSGLTRGMQQHGSCLAAAPDAVRACPTTHRYATSPELT